MNDRLAGVAEDRFGVELNAEDRSLAMPDGHDATIVVTGGRDFQARRQVFCPDGQRMIPCHVHRAGAARKQICAVMSDRTGHAMPGGIAYDVAPKGRPDRLMSQADTQYRESVGSTPDQFNAAPRFGRPVGAGRKDQCRGSQRQRLFGGDAIAADHTRLRPRKAKIPSQIVDKGVLIIQQQNHAAAPLRSGLMRR